MYLTYSLSLADSSESVGGWLRASLNSKNLSLNGTKI